MFKIFSHDCIFILFLSILWLSCYPSHYITFSFSVFPKSIGIRFMFGVKAPCNSLAFYLDATDFSLYQNIQTISGVYPGFCSMSGQSNQGIRLTICLLVLRIRMGGRRILFPQHAFIELRKAYLIIQLVKCSSHFHNHS